MRELLSSKKNIVCMVVLLCIYILNTYFYNASGDIETIIKYSKMVWQAIADGRFFDYYSYAFERMIPGTIPNYNYFIYLFFAICLSPVYLLNLIFASPVGLVGEILIVNSFLLAFVILSGFLTYRLSTVMGLNKRRSLEVFFVEQTSIILIFCSVGFCQFDIVYLDIVLCAMCFFVRGQYVRFSLIMSVAIMLKALPIIIFVPLILVVEKKIHKIIGYMLAGVSSTVIYSIVVRFDEGYSAVSSYQNEALNFLGRIFPEDIRLSWGYVSVFVIAFIIICFAAYDYDLRKENDIVAIVVIPIVTYGAFIVTVAWHPQWLVVIAPFIALAIVMNDKKRSLPWVDALLGISIVALLNEGLRGQVDNYMTNNGIVALIFESIAEGQTISDVIDAHFGYGSILCQSVLIAGVMYLIIVVVRIFRTGVDIEAVNNREYDLSYRIGIALRGAFLIIYPIGLYVFNGLFG